MTKGTTTKNASRSPARLGVEALEDRQLLNGKSLVPLVDLLSVPAAVPALVQSTPSLVPTTVADSVGVSKGNGSLLSEGLHLGQAKGPHAVDAGSEKTGSVPASDSAGVGVRRGGNLLNPSDSPKGGKGNDAPSLDAPSPAFHHSVTGSNANADSAGTADSPFAGPGPRPSSPPGDPPSLGIVLPLHHLPGVSDRHSPPDVPTAWSFLIAPTVLPAEEPEQSTPPLPSLKGPRAGDRSWDAYWGEFLPALPERPQGVTSAVAIGLRGAGTTQTVSEGPAPDMPEAGLLAADLPHGAGIGADLERLLEELNDLGSGIKEAVVRGRFAFWLLAGALAAAGCEVGRRRRQAHNRLDLTAADDADLRWFPEVSEPTGTA